MKRQLLNFAFGAFSRVIVRILGKCLHIRQIKYSIYQLFYGRISYFLTNGTKVALACLHV